MCDCTLDTPGLTDFPPRSLKSTKINTKGFEALLNLVNNTCSDSFELYYGLFLYNQNATEELERLEMVGGLSQRDSRPVHTPPPPLDAGLGEGQEGVVQPIARYCKS